MINKSYYAFDIHGIRQPNITQTQFTTLVEQNLAFWLTPHRSIRVITKQNLKTFADNKCIFCETIVNLQVIRGHTHKHRKNSRQKVLPEQFATVCQSCKEKYQSLTPNGAKNFANSKIDAIEDFAIRYPGSYMALLSKSFPNDGFQVIGYIDIDTAKNMIQNFDGKIINHSANDTLSLVTNSNSKQRKETKFKSQMEKFKKQKKLEGKLQCEFCGCQEESKMTVDHNMPISKGGENKENNFLIACMNCNLDKNTMTGNEYKAYIERKTIKNAKY